MSRQAAQQLGWLVVLRAVGRADAQCCTTHDAWARLSGTMKLFTFFTVPLTRLAAQQVVCWLCSEVLEKVMHNDAQLLTHVHTY